MVQKPKGKKQESRRQYMAYVKHFTNRKDRQAVREALAHEEYDKIPNNQRTKTEDPWAWD